VTEKVRISERSKARASVEITPVRMDINNLETGRGESKMRDFEDVDGDCNESQQRYDDEDEFETWDLDDIDDEDCEPDSAEPEDDLPDLPF
jgi:hypothetical protein